MTELTNTDLAVSLARLEGKVDIVLTLVPEIHKLDVRVISLEVARGRVLGALFVIPVIGSALAWIYDSLLKH